jgi:hypothetical protein
MTSEQSRREDVAISNGIEADDLAEIELHAARTFAVAPAPWMAQLETRQPIGCESSCGSETTRISTRSLYISLYMGAR